MDILRGVVGSLSDEGRISTLGHRLTLADTKRQINSHRIELDRINLALRNKIENPDFGKIYVFVEEEYAGLLNRVEPSLKGNGSTSYKDLIVLQRMRKDLNLPRFL